MLIRVALILCAIISVAACNKKSEPTATDTKPSEADAITTTEGPVKVGAKLWHFQGHQLYRVETCHRDNAHRDPGGPDCRVQDQRRYRRLDPMPV